MPDTPSNTDEAKGRIKEATGNLTGDKDLQNEGKLDQGEGKRHAAIGKADQTGGGHSGPLEGGGENRGDHRADTGEGPHGGLAAARVHVLHRQRDDVLHGAPPLVV